MMSNKPLMGGVILALALASGGGCTAPSQAESSDDEARRAADVDRVAVVRPERQDLTLTTTQPGRLESLEQTPLFAKLAGFVERIPVDIGDPVEKGQTLVELWIPELSDDVTHRKASVAMAEAQVRQAQAARGAARAAYNTAVAQVELSQARVHRVEADKARWESEFRRIESLAERGSINEKLVDETRLQLRSAEASIKETEADIRSAEASRDEADAVVVQAEADEAAAQARLQVAQAELARAESLLSYATIVAPFDGVIVRRGVDTGHFVSPADSGQSTPLVVVARTDVVRTFVDVPELEATLVTAGEDGARAQIRVQGLGGRSLEGHVSRTSGSLDPANRSLRTVIDIDNPAGQLRPGMFATATLTLATRQNAMTLPVAALIRNGDEAHVCKVEDGIVQRVPVTLGLRVGDRFEILSGVTDEDEIVAVRPEVLQDGQEVEVIEP